MVKKSANEYSYEEIEAGKKFGFERLITQEDVNKFAELTQDFNPLHMDKNYAEKTEFKGNIIHGMLAGSLFSTLVGMHCPGKKNLYLSQTLNFKKPIKPGSKVKVQGEVTNKIDAFKLIVIKTQILVNNEVCIDGEAKVKII